MKIDWSPVFLRSLGEIVDYIAEDHPKAAERWAVGVIEKVEKLERFPKRGRVVPEFGRAELRELRYGNYRIFYQIRKERIAMMTIRHSKRLLDPSEFTDDHE